MKFTENEISWVEEAISTEYEWVLGEEDMSIFVPQEVNEFTVAARIISYIIEATGDYTKKEKIKVFLEKLASARIKVISHGDEKEIRLI